MKKLFLLAAALLLPMAAVAQVSEFVGYRYKSVVPETILPNGVTNLGGGLVGDFESKPVWGVADMKKGRTRMLWLEKAAAEDASGVTDWEVTDVLSFANFPSNEELLFGFSAGECTEKGKGVDDMVVHARFFEKQKVYKTLKAWRTDLKTGRFQPIDAKNVKCRYDEP